MFGPRALTASAKRHLARKARQAFSNPHKQAPDVLRITQLVKLFGLPDIDELIERNADYFGEESVAAYRQALADGESEEAAGELAMEAERAAQDHLYHIWLNAVEQAAKEVFGFLGLDMVKSKRPRAELAYKLVPQHSWRSAAHDLYQTMTGVGLVGYDSFAEFLRAEGPSSRKAALSILHYAGMVGEVWGSPDAKRIYEALMR